MPGSHAEPRENALLGIRRSSSQPGNPGYNLTYIRYRLKYIKSTTTIILTYIIVCVFFIVRLFVCLDITYQIHNNYNLNIYVMVCVFFIVSLFVCPDITLTFFASIDLRCDIPLPSDTERFPPTFRPTPLFLMSAIPLKVTRVTRPSFQSSLFRRRRSRSSVSLHRVDTAGSVAGYTRWA